MEILMADDDCLYALGHVDKAEFAREVSKQFGVPITTDEVEHIYFREGPAPKSSGYDSYLHRCSHRRRNAFAVTLVTGV